MVLVVLTLQMWKQRLARGHTAGNGGARMEIQAVTLSQDTSFLSNYAGNAGSQVHLKSPINTDQAKEPLALTQTHSPPQSHAHSPLGHILQPFFLHAHEHRALRSCCAVGEYLNEMALQLAFSHLPIVF